MNPHARIAILVFPGCIASAATAPRDAFAIANAVAALRPSPEHVELSSVWVSVAGGIVTLPSGLSFVTERLANTDFDALIVPSVDQAYHKSLSTTLAALEAERQALREVGAGGCILATTCSGTYLLAEAGLLDGKRATTSWWLSQHFSKRYPEVALHSEEILVVDGGLVTSGGITSYLDLALWLIGHFCGDALRQMTAKLMVTDTQRQSQLPYVAEALMQGQGNAVVERARSWLARHLDQAWRMEDLAAHCHTSTRTLLRRFREITGMTPVQYGQQLRVERAKSLLESSALSIDTITERCGYEDVSTFSKVFKRRTGVTPRDYRRKFGLRA